MKITGIRLHFVHDDSPGLGCEPRPDALGPCVARFG